MATVDNREQWLAERRTGLGGSDIAKILGASVWGTAVDVYLDKKGLLPPQKENMAMKLGTALEPFVADQFMEKSGLRVIEYRPTIHGTGDNAFALGNLDRIVVEPHQDIDEMVHKLSAGDLSCVESILECKTSSNHDSWVNEETGEPQVPVYYAFQVMHYMGLVPSCKRVYVCVVFLGKFKDCEMFVIERDEAKIKRLFEIEREWWQKHILGDVMPEPQSKGEVIALYPNSTADSEKRIDDESGIEKAISDYKAAKAAKDKASEELDEAECKISKFLLDKETLLSKDGTKILATFRKGSDTVRDVTDWQAVAKELNAPEEVVKKYTEFGKITRRGSRPLKVFDEPKDVKRKKVA